MKAILRKSSANEPFSFVFVKGEETVLKSENYKAKESAKNGIESVKKNILDDKRIELAESKNGKFYFNLKATNGQIIATSALFDDGAQRDVAIATLKNEAPTAPLEERDI